MRSKLWNGIENLTLDLFQFALLFLLYILPKTSFIVSTFLLNYDDRFSYWFPLGRWIPKDIWRGYRESKAQKELYTYRTYLVFPTEYRQTLSVKLANSWTTDNVLHEMSHWNVLYFRTIVKHVGVILHNEYK